MTTNICRTLIVCLLLAAAVAALWLVFMRTSEEDRIIDACDALAAAVSKAPDEGNTALLLKSRSLDGLFAAQVKLNVTVYGIGGSYSAEELVSVIMRGRGMFQELNLNFVDITVEVSSEDKAAASFTARFEGRGRAGAATETVRVIQSFLRKIDGDWRFERFEEVVVMTK